MIDVILTGDHCSLRHHDVISEQCTKMSGFSQITNNKDSDALDKTPMYKLYKFQEVYASYAQEHCGISE